MCVYACITDQGRDGRDGGGCAGAAGPEWPPPEVQGGLPRQVFGAGQAEEGRSAAQRVGESQSRKYNHCSFLEM